MGSFSKWIKSKRENLLARWRGLQIIPVQIRAIPKDYHGSTIHQDTIRITGTQPFIDGVLARLRDILEYENQSNKIQIIYKPLLNKQTSTPTGSYVCYIHLKSKI